MGEPKENWDWSRTIHNLAVGLAPPEDLLTLYFRQSMIKPKRPKTPKTPSIPGSTIGLGPLPGAGSFTGMISLPQVPKQQRGLLSSILGGK